MPPPSTPDLSYNPTLNYPSIGCCHQKSTGDGDRQRMVHTTRRLQWLLEVLHNESYSFIYIEQLPSPPARYNTNRNALHVQSAYTTHYYIHHKNTRTRTPPHPTTITNNAVHHVRYHDWSLIDRPPRKSPCSTDPPATCRPPPPAPPLRTPASSPRVIPPASPPPTRIKSTAHHEHRSWGSR